MAEAAPTNVAPALFAYLLGLADDALVLGHRLSEWCGHGPALEEDIALANIALDCIGQASALLGLAAEAEGRGRTADELAFLRDALAYRNVQLVELPKGDFGFTIVRQLLFSAYAYLLYESLQQGPYEPLAGVAAKAFKEVRYHLRHCSEWTIRLGDGTDESHRRAQDALDELWMFTGELFEAGPATTQLAEQGIVTKPEALQARWREMVGQVLATATLAMPRDPLRWATGGRTGRHTEHLGHLLAEMQVLPRSFPGAEW